VPEQIPEELWAYESRISVRFSDFARRRPSFSILGYLEMVPTTSWRIGFPTTSCTFFFFLTKLVGEQEIVTNRGVGGSPTLHAFRMWISWRQPGF